MFSGLLVFAYFLFREVQTVVLSNIATMSSTRKVIIVYGNVKIHFSPKYSPDKYLRYIILIKFRACDNMIIPKIIVLKILRSGCLIFLFCPTQCGHLLLLTSAFPAHFFVTFQWYVLALSFGLLYFAGNV